MDEEPSAEVLLEHRRSVAGHRIPVLDAMMRAIDLGWPLVEAVERCTDRAEAQRRLTEPPFSFDEMQAAHVLDMQLWARTEERRRQLADEKAELERFLAEG